MENKKERLKAIEDNIKELTLTLSFYEAGITLIQISELKRKFIGSSHSSFIDTKPTQISLSKLAQQSIKRLIQ